MNNDLMLDYLLSMSALTPEEEQMKRKQAMVDALRKGSMSSPDGQMIGKHYVPPSLTQYAAQLGQGLMAGAGQKQVDEQFGTLNQKQMSEIERLRAERRRQQLIKQAGGFDRSVLGEMF